MAKQTPPPILVSGKRGEIFSQQSPAGKRTQSILSSPRNMLTNKLYGPDRIKDE